MSAAPRWIPSAVDRLLEQPHAHGFYQALRLLQRWMVREQGLSPEAALRRLHFRNPLELGFPASEIAALRQVAGDEAGLDPQDRAFSITPAFLGLTGSAGALPLFYTELLGEREHLHRDGAARAFFDIFLQRVATQLYQAWLKQRLALRFELEPGRHFLPPLLALSGGSAQGRIPDPALAYYAGRLQGRVRSADTLARLLGHHFGLKVRVTPLVGRWFRLDPAQQTGLARPGPGLGRGALVGARVWQRDQRVRLSLGPLSRTELRRFLPGAPGALALREWLRRLTGLSLEYELRLCLRADAVNPTRLDGAAALGQDSFLITRPSTQDRSEPGYALLAAA